MTTQFSIFKSNTDANSTNAGFYYQYLCTVKDWLDNYMENEEDTIIYCECGDDIQQDNKGDKKFTQIKCYSSDLGLNDEALFGSLLNFYRLYLQYPKAKFQFVSTSKLRKFDSIIKNWSRGNYKDNIDKTNAILSALRAKFEPHINTSLTEHLEKQLPKSTNSAADEQAINEQATNYKNRINDDEHLLGFIDATTFLFEEKTVEEAINAKLASISDLINEDIEQFDKNIDALVLVGYLIQLVADASSKSQEAERALTYSMLHDAIQKANSKDKKLTNIAEKQLLTLGQINEIKEKILDLSPKLDYIYNQLKQTNAQHIKHLTDYYTNLKGEYNKTSLDEIMALADNYIEPNIDFDAKNKKYSPYQTDNNNAPSAQNSIHNAHTFAQQFLTGKYNHLPPNVANQRIWLLLGYPGQGKTSFCRRLLHDNIDLDESCIESNNIFYVKLREINFSDLQADPLHCIYTHLCTHIPELSRPDAFNRAILVLDGLDELTMQEKISAADIDSFIHRLGDKIDAYKFMRLIITSRYGYINTHNISPATFIVTQLCNLTHEQQSDWLARYRQYNPSCCLDEDLLKEINKIKHKRKYNSLRELIQQPILLYMVAKSNMDLRNGTIKNRADIYNHLFDILCKRAWDNHKQIDALRKLSHDTLRKFIREIAFAIYKAPDGFIYQADIAKMPSANSFQKELGTEEISTILRQIMIAFYLKESNKESNAKEIPIEFLHKSLQEYLAAEYIVEQLHERCKFVHTDPESLLKFFNEHLGSKYISSEIMEYIQEQLKLKSWTTICDIMMERLAPFCEKEFLVTTSNLTRPISTATRSFYNYYHILRLYNHVAILLENDSSIYSMMNLPTANFKNSAPRYLSFNKLNNLSIYLDYNGLFRIIHRSIFEYIKFKLICENVAFFYDCTFKYSNFHHNNFENIHFVNCYFEQSDFLNTTFKYVYFPNCNFNATTFTKKQLEGIASLYGSSFEDKKYEHQLKKDYPHLFTKKSEYSHFSSEIDDADDLPF